MILSLLRKRLLTIIISLSIIVGSVEVCSPALSTEYSEYAVVIVVDGCRPEYLELASLPNIQELVKHGVTYRLAWVGQVPNNTPPAHATLGTGVFPAHHHVVGFNWKDPKTGRSFHPQSAENIQHGAFTKVISNAKVPSVFGLYKKMHPKERTLAISSVKPYAAISLGNIGADYILFTPTGKEEKRGKGEEDIETGKIVRFETLPGHDIDRDLLDQINREIKPYKQPGDLDTWAVEAFLAVFKAKRPKLSMINLPEIDDTGHKYGGISSPEKIKPVIENVDLQIGRIIKAFKEAGIFEKTLFVITADHGMVQNAYDISLGSYIFAFAGLRNLPQLGMTTPFIWLRDSNRSEVVAKSIAAMNPPGINNVFYKVSNNNGIAYQPASKIKRNSLDETYRYLLQTVACPNSPDIFLFPKENSIIGHKFPLNTRGKHYQTTWFAQHIPLIISGPGIKQNYQSDMPARIVDIPPTVLTVLGIEPSGMDGVILTDALNDPSPHQIELQKEIGAKLKEYQKALLVQSQYDLKELPGLPKPKIWNWLWFCNLGVLVFFGLVLFSIKVARVPGKVRKVVFLAVFFLLIASQFIFILLLRALLEV